MKVKHFMVPRNKLVTCDVSTTIEQANGVFLSNKIGSIVVTKRREDDKLQSIGIITKTDLLKAYFTGKSGKDMLVGDFMSKMFFSCSDDTELNDIAEQMSKDNIHHVIVLNEKGEIVGITSSLDIAKQISSESKDVFPYFQSLFGIPKSKEDAVTQKILETLAPFTVDDQYTIYNQ